MKQIQKLFKLFTIVMAMAALGTTDAFASSTYYSKVTVTSTGNGKVYVAKASTASPAYAETASATNSGAQDQKYYLYAQAEDGYKFEGWYSDEACTKDKEASNPFVATVTATATSSSKATSFTWYAKFVEASAATLGYTETKVYVNIDNVTYKNESLVAENLTSAIAYASANEKVVTVAADGTLTPVANGTTTITASADGAEASYEVTIIDNVAAGKTQIGNGDFEDWRGATSSNNAPDNWNSFQTAEGNFASFVKAQQVAMKEGGRPGSNGKYYVDIYSRSVIGVPAQGNLTLGCINAGATSAADKNNYNFSKVADAKKSETIDAIPTAIKAWVKFVPGKANADYPYARIAATIHDEYNYITYGQASDDTEANKSHALAQAEQNFEACDWTELTIPFTLTNNAVVDGQLYIIFNASTNASPGKGQDGDHLYIDDIELVYDTDYDKVPVTVSDAKYATFVAPFDVKMPAAITASTVATVGTEVEAKLDLEAVEGNLVPANTPVILNSEDAQNRVAYGVADPAEAVEGLLTGVYADTEAPVGSYVLQNIDGVVGFYQVAAGQQPTVKANHAYLTAASEAKVFVFTTDDATAIQGIQAEAEQGAAIYNLAGQRVQKAVKGINIINGKKILK